MFSALRPMTSSTFFKGSSPPCTCLFDIPMQQPEKVAIFWDYENLVPNSSLNGYEIVENIRSIGHTFGSVILLKAYLEIPMTSSPRSICLRSELQASGVSLTDCPHNGGKDIAEKMLIVDMIAFAIDNPAPATIILISGDRDYAYAVSILRLRKYRVVIICPSNSHGSLMAQASVYLDWNTEVLGQAGVPEEPIPPPNPRPVTPSRKRAGSTASRPYAPRASNTRDLDLEDDKEQDDDIYGPYNPECNPYSARVNGAGDRCASSRFVLHDPVGPSAEPSRTTSKLQSPPTSFRSAKSSPPTPPVETQAPESTFVTVNGNGTFESARLPSLPSSFQFSEPEPITLKPQMATEQPAGALRSPGAALAPTSPASTPALLSSAPTFKIFNFGLPREIPSMPKPVSPFFPPPMNVTPAPAAVPAPAATSSMPPPGSRATPSSPAPAPSTKLESEPTPPPPSAPPSAPTPVSNSKPAVGANSGSLQAPPPAKGPASSPSSGQAKPHLLPSHFRPLLEVLENRRRSKSQVQVLRSELGGDLSNYKKVYKEAGANSFAMYISLAEEAGLVIQGGRGNNQWIKLSPAWSASL